MLVLRQGIKSASSKLPRDHQLIKKKIHTASLKKENTIITFSKREISYLKNSIKQFLLNEIKEEKLAITKDRYNLIKEISSKLEVEKNEIVNLYLKSTKII